MKVYLNLYHFKLYIWEKLVEENEKLFNKFNLYN